MNEVVVGGLFGVGGVVLGVVLNGVVDSHTRKRVREEQMEQARHTRELVAAESLDEALIAASSALDQSTKPLEERYADARDAWEEGWVWYSPRIRQRELLNRYEVVGSILAEVVHNTRTTKDVPRHVVARAIANARSTLAHFMRGDGLPATAFPEPAELRSLIIEGETGGEDDPMGPLKRWSLAHPLPNFHDDRAAS